MPAPESPSFVLVFTVIPPWASTVSSLTLPASSISSPRSTGRGELNRRPSGYEGSTGHREVAEEGAILLGRRADAPVKRRSNRRRRAETREATDLFDRLRRRLQKLARPVEACISEPRHRSHSRLLAEPARECSPGHVRALSEHVEVERKREIFPHPLAKRIKLVAVLFGPHQPIDVLGLSAMALWWCDQVAGACVGRGRAVVTADQMEAQIDASCDTGGREEVAVVDEEAVRQHLDLGEAALQLVGPSPMRRRATSVEDAGQGEGESARANRHQADAFRV